MQITFLESIRKSKYTTKFKLPIVQILQLAWRLPNHFTQEHTNDSQGFFYLLLKSKAYTARSSKQKMLKRWKKA